MVIPVIVQLLVELDTLMMGVLYGFGMEVQCLPKVHAQHVLN
jgi:hypothetical protein